MWNLPRKSKSMNIRRAACNEQNRTINDQQSTSKDQRSTINALHSTLKVQSLTLNAHELRNQYWIFQIYFKLMNIRKATCKVSSHSKIVYKKGRNFSTTYYSFGHSAQWNPSDDSLFTLLYCAYRSGQYNVYKVLYDTEVSWFLTAQCSLKTRFFLHKLCKNAQ